MKINRPNKIAFGELCSGDAFIYKNKFYMKSEFIEDLADDSYAVNLANGEIKEFSDEEEVEELPDAELTI